MRRVNSGVARTSVALMGAVAPSGGGDGAAVGKSSRDEKRHLRGSVPALLLFMSVSPASAFDDPVSHPVGDSPAGVTIGDVDGDALADVAVAKALSGDVSLLFNDGSGLPVRRPAEWPGAAVSGRGSV